MEKALWFFGGCLIGHTLVIVFAIFGEDIKRWLIAPFKWLDGLRPVKCELIGGPYHGRVMKVRREDPTIVLTDEEGFEHEYRPSMGRYSSFLVYRGVLNFKNPQPWK